MKVIRTLIACCAMMAAWISAPTTRGAEYEWGFTGNLNAIYGGGALIYADATSQALTTFATTNGTTVPHINGQPASYMRVPAFTTTTQGYNAEFTSTTANGGGSFVNQYTMVFDVLSPNSINWTPFFNTNPANTAGNDADFYIAPDGSIGIADLGYSAAGLIAPDTWNRVTFSADLGAGTVAYYVNGTQVHQRTGASLLDGRFSMFSNADVGADLRLFNEGLAGAFTHELLVNSFYFIDRTLSAGEIADLGGPKSAGIGPLPSERSWDGDGGADTSFRTAANWSSNTIPGTNDIARFDRGDALTYTTTFDRASVAIPHISTRRLLVGSNTVTFDPSATPVESNYLINSPTTAAMGHGIVVGAEADDTAAVLISHLPLLQTAAATIGEAAGSIGTLTLNEDGDQFNVTGSAATDTELYIGRLGTGVLNVSGGADVNVSGSVGNVVLGSASSSQGTANIDGAGSTWNIAGSLVAGVGGMGTINVSNGGAVTTTGGSGTYLGHAAGSSGKVTLASSSTFTNAGPLHVGYNGNGSLEITGDATLTSSGNINIGNFAGSTGDVTVDGLNSSLTTSGNLYVGNLGTGTLEISGGGGANASAAYIGYAAGSLGRVTVDGMGSSFVPAHVGVAGDGTLEIINGASLSMGTLFIAEEVGSKGTVRIDGAGSRLISNVDLKVGIDGDAIVEITNGGQLDSTAGDNNSVGFDGASGTVTVSGDGSMWYNPGELHVGKRGNGTVYITDGGWLNSGVSGYAFLGFENTPFPHSGKVVVQGTGSKWTTVSGDIRVGNGEKGSLTVEDGGRVEARHVYLNPLGELLGDGTIDATVENNGGLVSPGSSTGTLHIDGDYTAIGNTKLLIELASAGYDQLQVTLTATLSGTLEVVLADEFVPTAGQSYAILTAAMRSGIFSTELLPTAENLVFDVVYNPGSVVVTVTSTLPGDYNGNGVVDAADYVVWRDNVGAATINNRDPNEIGPVGIADYNFWRARFGQTAGGGAGAAMTTSHAAVPEPVGTLLLSVGTLACSILLRRARSCRS
jgi:T5SS/PEP-CTERM-associated repeat protein